MSAARLVVEECNGTEFERTANMMDLSYVADEMDFADGEVKCVRLYRSGVLLISG